MRSCLFVAVAVCTELASASVAAQCQPGQNGNVAYSDASLCEHLLDRGEARFLSPLAPFTASIGVEISEISGLSLAGEMDELGAVGDGGRLYWISLEYPSQSEVPRINFTKQFELHKPGNMTHVDAESIVIRCPKGNITEAGENCLLENPDTTILVGVERGRSSGNRAGIFEYNSTGELISMDGVPENVLFATSTDSDNQQVNLGFESLSAPPSNGNLLRFVTEGHVFPDANISKARRLVALGDGNLVRVFRYEADLQGVSEMEVLDNYGNYLAVLERSYDNVTEKNQVRLFGISLLDNFEEHSYSFYLPSGIKSEELTEKRGNLTKAFHQLKPVHKSLLFSLNGSNSEDENYEALSLLDCSRMLMVSDDNENPRQSTKFLTLKLEFSNSSDPIAVPSNAPTTAPHNISTQAPTNVNSTNQRDEEAAHMSFTSFLLRILVFGLLFALGGVFFYALVKLCRLLRKKCSRNKQDWSELDGFEMPSEMQRNESEAENSEDPLNTSFDAGQIART